MFCFYMSSMVDKQHVFVDGVGINSGSSILTKELPRRVLGVVSGNRKGKMDLEKVGGGHDHRILYIIFKELIQILKSNMGHTRAHVEKKQSILTLVDTRMPLESLSKLATWLMSLPPCTLEAWCSSDE